jgi:hypothetical protein
MGETKVNSQPIKDYIEGLSGFAGNDRPLNGILSARALHAELEMIKSGPDARIHHSPGTVFEVADLFLAWSRLLSTEDSAKLDDEWCGGAIAEALEQRRAAMASQPESPGCAAPVAAEGSQADDKFWDAVKEVAKSR